MSEHVLVSPLGFSPGAVSGLTLALIEENYPISRVITVGTSHHKVMAAARCLENLFRDLEDLQYEPQAILATELRDSGTTKSNATDAFVTKMGAALKAAAENGNTVHVGVTGGRAGMGALAALATNLYGADYLWHFWVTEEIETGGRNAEMLQPVSLENRYLNPTVEPGNYELVRLPLVDLRPLQPFIWQYYLTGHYPDPASPFYNLFISGQIDQLENVFPEALTIGQVARMLKMAAEFGTAVPDTQDELLDELSNILRDAGVVDATTKQKMRLLVKGGATPEQVLNMLQEKGTDSGFMHWLKRTVHEHHELITTATSIVSLLADLGKLYLDWRAKGP